MNEAMLPVGAALHANVALKYFEQQQQQKNLKAAATQARDNEL